MRRHSIVLLVLGVLALSLALVFGAGLAGASPAPAPSGSPGPGLQMQISKVEIGADNKPVVTFKLTDAKGVPFKASDLDANSLRFTLAKIVLDKDTGLTHYENYFVNQVKGTEFTFNGQKKQPALATTTQVSSAMDQGGKLTETDTGYTYVFTNTLPANYDKTATHVLGAQATRDARAYVANAVFSFVPAGGTPVTREVVKTDNCNGCHDPLQAHGGTRRETSFCVLCHTSQTVDPQSGNSVEFKVLVHRIHSGAKLPSVVAGKPFFIGGENHNFSDIVFPQDTRNCTTCHTGGKNSDNWKTAPSAAACTSCHDNVNVRTGENHPGGPQPSDASCQVCHPPDGKEFDASIAGSHTIPNNSKQLRGIKFQLVSVTNAKPGQKPTVIFNIKDNAGATIDPKDMDSVALTLAGPTTDYTNRWTDTVARKPSQASLAKDAGGGNFSYTFQNPLPADATGTYAVGMEGYLIENIKKADGSVLLGPDKKPLAVRDAGFNPVVYVAVTDANPVARRKVVLRDNCNQCHKDLGNPAGLSVHGGSRRNTEYCVLCHNPTLSDAENHPADKGAPIPLQWKYLVHRIHTGTKGSSPYVLYGSNGQPNNLGDVRFPGNTADCGTCHDKNTNLLPLPSTVLPTTATKGGKLVSSIQPIAAACTACHDSKAAKGHAGLQTTASLVETCTVCHGEGREFAVSKVHK